MRGCILTSEEEQAVDTALERVMAAVLTLAQTARRNLPDLINAISNLEGQLRLASDVLLAVIASATGRIFEDEKGGN